MFNKCGMRFAFRYIQGIKTPPNAFLLCGTATDKAINWDLDTKILRGELATLDEISDIARDSIDHDDRADSILLDEDDAGKSVKQVIGETKDRAVRLVTMHHGQVAPNLKPWRTQRKFTVNMDKFLRTRAKLLHEEADMPDLSPWRRRVMNSQAAALNSMARQGLDFVGEQDIVEKYHLDILDETYGVETLNVRDTKTAKARKNQEQVDNDDQLTAYAAGSMIIDGRLPDDLIFDVLVETTINKTQSTQEIKTKRTETDVDVYLNRIANAVASIQLGIFPPTQQTNWWCSEKWCGYHNICPYFRRTHRPGDPIAELQGAGHADDLLPILNQSLEEVAKKKVEDEEEGTKL